MNNEEIVLADDNTESVGFLFKLRIPSLIVGLVLGIFLAFVTSRFEEVLSKNIAIAYFIPLVVYLADAVGTQTQSIFTRGLKTGANFMKYFTKESCLGILFGLIFGLLVIPFIILIFNSKELAFTIAISLFLAIASAPLVSLGVSEVLQKENRDPAVGAGPIATVIQDTLSVLIYGFVASIIIL